ncbi:MAG: PhoH family protein [Candidatus Dependentiae bacterium]|nr:PhoH family protein [Candidatus Dependentiae bacterium]
MACDLLFDDEVQLVTLFGPAGTGKTFLALVAGLHKLLIEHEYKKVLVARPVEPLGRDIGYLPGDIQEKLYSWMQPVRDNMDFIMYKAQSQHERGAYDEGEERQEEKHEKGRRRRRDSRWKIPSLEELTRTDRVSLEAIAYMRGRSIPDQYILIDEVQNLTPREVKTLITRVGEGSKIILAGDPYQIDSPYLDFSSNGLVISSEKFKGQQLVGTVFLDKSERSELSTLAAQLL